MDEYVKDLLRQWQLEELIPKFEDEEVNEKAFKCLTDDIIRELIPKLGKRAIFNAAYKTFREELDRGEGRLPTKIKQSNDPLPSSSASTSNAVKSESAIVEPSDAGSSKNSFTGWTEKLPAETVKLENAVPTTVLPTDDTLDTCDEPEEPSQIPTTDPEPTRITFNISGLENLSDEDRSTADNLRQFLSTSEAAYHLLGKTFLTRSSRNLLVEAIVDHLYATNDGVLSNHMLHCWARAVEQVFHDEISGLYFRQTESGSSCGGKLVECYRRLKQMKAEQY